MSRLGCHGNNRTSLACQLGLPWNHLGYHTGKVCWETQLPWTQRNPGPKNEAEWGGKDGAVLAAMATLLLVCSLAFKKQLQVYTAKNMATYEGNDLYLISKFLAKCAIIPSFLCTQPILAFCATRKKCINKAKNDRYMTAVGLADHLTHCFATLWLRGHGHSLGLMVGFGM